MADIKLYYFDARGVAEVSRLVLAFAKQPYEDIRWSMDDWPKYKKESPFGQSPWIEYKGEKRSQSIGISIFLAQKFGLYGKTHLEALRIDEVVYLVRDVRLVWAQVDQEKNPTKKAELETKFEEQDLPKFLDTLLNCWKKTQQRFYRK
ncbi:glutathione S-transferase 4-like [Pomacea canaliculata]|uniref:glutathione S-transferase 4-like n=1 Tax=Pomacea canaliculata TaxID=400727 RepID=UPI000D72647B|nr:glutathione S-transferase 4-like [Pomacea canaliculata]